MSEKNLTVIYNSSAYIVTLVFFLSFCQQLGNFFTIQAANIDRTIAEHSNAKKAKPIKTYKIISGQRLVSDETMKHKYDQNYNLDCFSFQF